MKQAQLLVIAILLSVVTSSARTKSTERFVDLKTANGTLLKGTYFGAAKPGPGVLLSHQSNRTRKSWDDVGHQLAAAGINALTVDIDPNKTRKRRWPGELNAAFEVLRSRPGVEGGVIGVCRGGGNG